MPGPTPDGVDVRLATPEDRLGVSHVLDGAMLSVPALSDRLAAGEVLVAVDDSGADERILGAVVVTPDGPHPGDGDGTAPDGPRTGDGDGAAPDGPRTGDDDGTAPDGPRPSDGDAASATTAPPSADWRTHAHVEAIAVRTRRRDRGIGSALVDAAVARFGPLVAEFDRRVRPFYESLDAEVRPASSDRCWALIGSASD